MLKRSILGSVLICTACALPLGAREPTTVGDPNPAERELNMLVGQLADPTRDDKTKVEAAELLLIRPDPRAAKLLVQFLKPSTPPNPRAQIAVAEAIARSGVGKKEFIDPLMAVLQGEEETVRSSAARALATYKDDPVLDKLIGIARSGKQSKAVRLATIAAFRQVLDKKTIDVLVYLLDDKDEDVAAAAADSLAKLTNISAFRKNRQLAKTWWQRNRSKKRTEWLADLADSLARANTMLEAENKSLRERLQKAMSDMYVATPAAQRDAMLVGFLNDPLADVRLVGATLTGRKIANNETVSEEIRNLIRRMLLDTDPRCRQAAALLVASLGDKEALEALLGNLKAEETPAVRRALYSALGKLRNAKALPAVLEGVRTEPDGVLAAAAAALAQIASKQPLDEAQRARAVGELVQRYRAAAASTENAVALREALIGAMGVLGPNQKAVLEILQTALKDPAATIRLAAVNALGQTAQADCAAQVAPLLEDADRGVRQAAISVLATLSGPKALKTILQRTTAAESDATVRQYAWDAVLSILKKADVATMEDVLASLADRIDAAPERIKIMQMLAEALRTQQSPKLPDALRRLGAMLLEASRPAEAAPALAEAYTALVAAESDQAPGVWGQWVDALLKADDPAAIKAIADQKDDAACAATIVSLIDHLGKLAAGKKYAAVILLSDEARKTLAKRLTAEQLQTISLLSAEAHASQSQADLARVAELAPQLVAAADAARQAAKSELQTLGDRAVPGLLDYLKKVVGAENPIPEAEKAILEILRQIAPKLTGYDPLAPKAEKLKVIDAWIKG